jgi:hypothetical protein
MSAYTTLDLIKSVRVRGMLPDASEGSFSADNILLLASEELRLNIVPLILSVREKYYETYTDVALESGKGMYKIPERAIGGLLTSVQYIVNQAVTNLNPVEANAVATTNSGLYPRAFYFENDHVVIYPTPNSTQGDLRLRYPQRPSILTQTINAAQITAVDASLETVTVSTYPSTWAPAMVIDFISNINPYTPYGIETSINNITANNSDFTFSFVDLPYDRDGNIQVKVGDWIALAGYTPLPEIMSEFFPLLAQATAVKCFEANGDEKNMAMAASKLKYYSDTAIKLITPRDQYGNKKIKSDWRNW